MEAQLQSENLKCYGLSALTGLLLALAFPLFNWAFLAWFAFLPLFFAVQSSSPAKAAKQGLVAGMVFYSIGLSWVVNTMVDFGHLPVAVSWLVLMLLVGYLSLFIALFCYLAKKLSRGNPVFFYLLAPVLWTSLEYLRSTHEVFGFSWLGLGYSQSSKLPAIQIAEFTGVYGVTALIVLVNSGLFYISNSAIISQPLFSRFRLPVAGITLALLAGCWLYGIQALKQHEAIATQTTTNDKSLTVALIQGNIAQSMKWDPAHRDGVLLKYLDLTRKAAESTPDLIVWPEAATPFYYGKDEGRSQLLRQTVEKLDTPLLFGSPALGEQQNTSNPADNYFNSAYYIDGQGATLGRYDKIHLVPFGEFVPFRKILFFVDKMVVGIGEFGRGDSYDVFDLKKNKFGVNICYEIIFPDLVRQPVKRGAQFLVNITNDAWFGKSAASYQHIAIAALRAVENRVPIIRAANTGITGILHADGTINQATELFVEDIVVGKIKPRQGPPTFYSQYGDVFCWLCLSLTVIFAFLSRLLSAEPTSQR